MDDSTTASERQGMWSMIKQGYEGLVLTVIRPARALYAVEELGPTKLLLGDTVTQRQDMQLKNPAGYTLECSWWKPSHHSSSSVTAPKTPCIIVLHGNSSCRLGCLEIVSFAIPAGFSVFALDFSGSGLSTGKYVSLGYHEQTDIATVVKYLRAQQDVSKICLWGRSMGAVASLLYAQNGAEISAMVLDSPFSSLPRLAVELVDDGKLGVPRIAVKLVMRLIRRDIKRRARFDMFKLKPIEDMNRCTTPSFFVAGTQDELVGPHHVEALHRRHNGPNQLFRFSGGHNSPRPINMFIQALQFLRVMVGLLPLPSHVFTTNEAGARTPISSPRRRSVPAPTKRATGRVYKNPLPAGVSIESVHHMSVKQLKDVAASVGYGDVPCVEKSDLIDLVLKLHQRHLRSKQAARKFSEDEVVVAPSTAATPSGNGKSHATRKGTHGSESAVKNGGGDGSSRDSTQGSSQPRSERRSGRHGPTTQSSTVSETPAKTSVDIEASTDTTTLSAAAPVATCSASLPVTSLPLDPAPFPAPNSSPASSAATFTADRVSLQASSSPPLVRRYSDSSVAADEPVRTESMGMEIDSPGSADKKSTAPTPFPVNMSTSSSVISDRELTRELSGRSLIGDGSDADENDRSDDEREGHEPRLPTA